MAPEIMDGEKYSEKIDMFALGLTVLQMVTNEPPYSECQAKGLMDYFNKVKFVSA